MNNIGRLAEDATVEEKLEKFTEISNGLKEHGISLLEISHGNPVLVDETCDFKMMHNHITWCVYDVEEVVEMIVNARNIHKDKIENE